MYRLSRDRMIACLGSFLAMVAVGVFGVPTLGSWERTLSRAEAAMLFGGAEEDRTCQRDMGCDQGTHSCADYDQQGEELCKTQGYETTPEPDANGEFCIAEQIGWMCEDNYTLEDCAKMFECHYLDIPGECVRNAVHSRYERAPEKCESSPI